MNNALIICTYMRPKAIKKLLESVIIQTKLPQQIIIVDGSINNETKDFVYSLNLNIILNYYLVDKDNRGLTKQRNFGVSKVNDETELVSFLDDDIVLEPNYFEEINRTFLEKDNAIGVGGIDLEENRYFEKDPNIKYSKFNFYEIDGWVVNEPLRYKVRKLFGLMPDLQPDIIPDYSHGRSGFPPNGITYEVEHFMGGIATYKKELFSYISFSRYFEGYGLYEDFDFCVRSLPFGKLYINTNAKVWHYHEPAGRPNQYKYGKMVVRNGWYVWKQRFPKNTLIAFIKWHAAALLLTKIRLINIISGPNRFGAFMEYLGRIVGWFSLIMNKPKINK